VDDRLDVVLVADLNRALEEHLALDDGRVLNDVGGGDASESRFCMERLDFSRAFGTLLLLSGPGLFERTSELGGGCPGTKFSQGSFSSPFSIRGINFPP